MKTIGMDSQLEKKAEHEMEAWFFGYVGFEISWITVIMNATKRPVRV